MTALSADKAAKTRNHGDTNRYPLGVDIFYNNALVMLNAAGYLVPAAAATDNNGVVGVFAGPTTDNSGGSAGDLSGDALECDVLVVAVGATQGDVGEPMYASDDQTVSSTNAGTEPVAGICLEYVSATAVWVRADRTNAR
jgi:hypothetical protein